VIEFYIPESYHPKPKPASVSITCGKLLEFRTLPPKRSA